MATPGISAEQLKRMEDNKRKARERLAVKKQHPQPEASGTPPRKRRAVEPPSHSTATTSCSSSQSLYRAQPQAAASVRPASGSFQYTHQSVAKPYCAFQDSPKFYSKTFGHTSSEGSTSKAAPQTKFSALQKTIKANLTLVSKSRFRVTVPYDLSVLELFKKMPTKSYGNCWFIFTT